MLYANCKITLVKHGLSKYAVCIKNTGISGCHRIVILFWCLYFSVLTVLLMITNSQQKRLAWIVMLLVLVSCDMIKRNESLVENFNFNFLHHSLITSICFILIQPPLQLDIWLQSYEGFFEAKNNIKQRNLNTVFANILKTTSPTSDSFLLIMSHMVKAFFFSFSII